MNPIGPLMLDIAGTSLTEEDIQLIRADLCGGLILFSRNFESADQIYSLTQAIRSINPQIIIAVDQEGGRVQRFKEGFSSLPPLNRLGKCFEINQQKAIRLAAALGELMASEVLAVGCDISFAPVLDLGFATSKVIGDRAFSTDPHIISELATAYIDGMKTAGMAATGKHFPGHGSVEADSHFELPIDHREWELIANSDLIPFIQLKDQLKALMPAHIIFEKIDRFPAGFSKVWLQEILRSKIGFNGVIFSDDLTMEGATVIGDFPQRAAAALDAGCDMILVCNNRPATIQVLNALKDRAIDVQSSARLESLRMQTPSIGLSALKLTQRWQELKTIVSELN